MQTRTAAIAILACVIGIALGVALSKPRRLAAVKTVPSQLAPSELPAASPSVEAGTEPAWTARPGAGAASAAPGVHQAQVVSLSGQVEWRQAGSETWQPATINQQLAGSDKIRTAQESRVTLGLDEGSTIELFPGSEFSIQTLSKDPQTQQRESVFGIWQGKLVAKVSPLTEGSTFQFETPTTTVNVVGTTLTITINPDGSVSVRSDEGTVELIREGDHRMRLTLETGEHALVEYDPATGVLRVTSLSGTFDVTGPDNVLITLADGDTAVWSGGAATYIPGTPPVGDAPAAETLGEPVT